MDKKPMDRVNVHILGKSGLDTTILSFELSDSNGKYKITIPLDSTLKLSIQASALGYAPYFYDFEGFATKNIVHDIKLIESSVSLDSVIVTAKKWPVIVKTDTTSYIPSAFSNGTERNVEELLKKIPGITVADNGRVSVNGKEVEKIFLDGEDIFSDKYQLITKNLNPKLLSKIEAIDNYSNNPLLRTLQKSNKTVLNLSILESEKATIFGDVNLTGGTLKRGEVAATIFSLIKKLKFGLVANANNLANEPIANAQYYLENSENNNSNPFLDLNIGKISPFINTELPRTALLSNDRYVFNKARLLGYSFSSKIKKKSKIYGNIIGSLDNQFTSEFTNYKYLVSSSESISFNDSVASRRLPSTIQGIIKFESNLSKNSFLQFSSSFNNSKSSLNQNFISQNIVFPDVFQLENNSKQTVFTNTLNLTEKFSENLALDIKMGYLHQYRPQKLFSDSKRYQQVFETNSPIKDFSQIVDQNSSHFNMGAELIGKRGKYKYKLKASYDAGIEKLSNSRYFNEKLDVNDSNNSQFLEKEILIIGGEWQRTFNKLKIVLGSDILFPKVSSNISLSKYNKPIISPVIFLGNKFNQNHGLYFILTQSVSLPNITEINSNKILTNYRAFTSGSGTFLNKPSQILSINYNIGNTNTLTFLNLSATALRSFNTLIDSTFASNILISRKLLYYNDPLFNLNTNISLNQTIRAISTQIRGSIGTNFSESYNYLNSNIPVHNLLNSYESEIAFSTSFTNHLFFEAGLRNSVFKLEIPLNTTNDSFKTKQNNPFYVLRYKFNEFIYIKLLVEQLIWKQQNQPISKLNFADFSSNINFKESKWSAGFNIKNIFNKNVFKYNTLGYNLTTQNSRLLQPRIFSINIGYKI